jgi:hypothetical protein
LDIKSKRRPDWAKSTRGGVKTASFIKSLQMARTTYLLSIAVGLLMGIILFLLRDEVAVSIFIYVSLLPFFFFTAGVHGFIAHSYNMRSKLHLIVFPVFMGMLYVFLLFIHLFFIVPWVCPDFRW